MADAVNDGDQPVAIILLQPDGETAVITAKDREAAPITSRPTTRPHRSVTIWSHAQ
ncbi:MAG: hypothetical protein R2755_05020 [Acidimicrobiales bacterium]